MDGDAGGAKCAVSALKERLASVDWLVRECLRRDTEIEQLKLRVSELEKQQLSVKDKPQTVEKACQVNIETTTLASTARRSTLSSTSSSHLLSGDSEDEIVRDTVFSSEEEIMSPLRSMHPPQLMTPMRESSEDEVLQTVKQSNSGKVSSAKRSIIDTSANKAETITKQTLREKRQEQKHNEAQKKRKMQDVNEIVERSERSTLSTSTDEKKGAKSSPQIVTSMQEAPWNEVLSKTSQEGHKTSKGKKLVADSVSNQKSSPKNLANIGSPQAQEALQSKITNKDSEKNEENVQNSNRRKSPNQIVTSGQEPSSSEEIAKTMEDEEKLAEAESKQPELSSAKEVNNPGLRDNEKAFMSPPHLVISLPDSSPTQISEPTVGSPFTTDPSENSQPRLPSQIATLDLKAPPQNVKKQTSTVSEEQTLDSESYSSPKGSSLILTEKPTACAFIEPNLAANQNVAQKRTIDVSENLVLSPETDGHNKRQRLEVSRDNNSHRPTTSMTILSDHIRAGGLIGGSFLKYLDREAENKLASRRIEMETRLRRFKEPSSGLAAASNHFKTQLGRLWGTLDGATFANVVRQLTSDYLTDYDKIFFDVILKAVKEEKQELDKDFPQIYADHSVPNLSVKQRKIVSLLHALGKNGTANENMIPNFINYLFFYIAKSRYLAMLPLREAVSIIRIYLALLRLTEDEVAGKTFVFDIFFFGISRKHVYLSLLIEIWPQLMRWHGFASTSTEELDPLVETVLYMVFNTSPKGFQAEMMIGETRRALGLLGFHQNSIPSAGQLVIKLIKRVISSEESNNQELMNSVTMSLALLGSAQEPSWVDINIQSRLLDHMKQTKNADAQKTVEVTAWVIHTMGMVVKANPHGDRDHLLQLLESVIGMLQRPQPQPLMNACLQSLVRIGGHHQVQVAKFLNRWRPQPEQDLLLSTKDLLTNFVGTRGHKYCTMTLELKDKGREKGKPGGRGGGRGRGNSKGKNRGKRTGRGGSNGRGRGRGPRKVMN